MLKRRGLISGLLAMGTLAPAIVKAESIMPVVPVKPLTYNGYIIYRHSSTPMYVNDIYGRNFIYYSSGELHPFSFPYGEKQIKEYVERIFKS